MDLPEMANHQRVTNRSSADLPIIRGISGRAFCNTLAHSRMQIINPQTHLIVLKQVYLRFGESAECGLIHIDKTESI